jgi:hypothetical protein
MSTPYDVSGIETEIRQHGGDGIDRLPVGAPPVLEQEMPFGGASCHVQVPDFKTGTPPPERFDQGKAP